MKMLAAVLLGLATLAGQQAQSQETDVDLAVRGDKLHFHVYKGEGLPILFEAGGGDDSTVWAGIAKPLHDITGATLITYDRAGFGRSELDGRNQAVDAHGIENGVAELDEALHQLGYDGKIMLVAHSYGALYATLYASKHPQRIKTAVLVDGSSACWFTEDWMKDFVREQGDKKPPTSGSLGSYYQSKNLPKTVEIVRANAFPASIPIIDLVSDHPPFSSDADISRWKECHRTFVDAAPNRLGIKASGTGHYIYRDNPLLVIQAIVKAYAGVVDGKAARQILARDVDYSIEAVNKASSLQDVNRH
ncbi:alpha/beta fold hydrolase [Pinirhizobacter soli]|uniref:alpha/beta fold hydrolase n=1 Tax=Pinirhizobacter soli TaxID=2786953 RepID=UPI002029BEF8|nr:alpha/beta hydrolase [Pinirhizobacter soli]